MRVYLEKIKFYCLRTYAKMTQWFERSAPEPELGVRLQAGTYIFFLTFILFLFLFFRTGHRESDLLFLFSLKVAHFSKIMQPCL